MSIHRTVSIVVPAFNREHLLPKTIKSVLNQSYDAWELIIVDDGSTDDTVNVIKGYASKDDRIIIKSRDRLPKGAPTCRNIGMGMAKGDYLMYLDSDDTLEPYCLERRVRYMEKNSHLDYSIWNVLSVFKDGTTKVWNDLNLKDDLKSFLLARGWQTSSSFFKRDFVKDFEWDENACSWQDWEFHIRILLANTNYDKNPKSEPDVFIDRTPTARISSSNRSPIRIECLLRLFEKIERLLKAKGKHDYIENLKAPWYSFLEVSAVELDQKNFRKFLSIFKNAGVHRYVARPKLILSYLKLQNTLRKRHLTFLQFIPYRFMKYYGEQNWL
ncbi:glycosyltransferase family 2 protein [Roseivirga sp.]|uniref:glycosyltransferase family 2 protein n=1 Tax=Roseivirga sp. TaxID=1964215 RepID=UPI003B8DDE49